MTRAKVLLLDLDPLNCLGSVLREVLAPFFSPGGQLRHEPVQGFDPASCAEHFRQIDWRFDPDLVFLILAAHLLPSGDASIQAIKKTVPRSPVIAVTESGKADDVFGLLEVGASDFVTPPLKPMDILPRVWRLLRQVRRVEDLPDTLKLRLGFRQLVGRSSSFMTEVGKIPLIARSDASVLVSGETGTGKELFARAIHYSGLRTHRSFVPVNCGAIPPDLIENELFGHTAGAFTGASGTQQGLIQEADGGTLFLDEVDCLPLLAQVKLLRFLQEKEYRPLGAAKLRQADVRIVSATNIDLEAAVRDGKFRQDLFYRLNVIPLTLPPLRERREDIPILASHFLEKYSREFNKPLQECPPSFFAVLKDYDWPGNVRELEHVIERIVALSEHGILESADIPLSGPKPLVRQQSFSQAKATMIEQFERSYIQSLLLTHRGNITKAARAAQKNRRAFWQLIRKHRIDVRGFRSVA